MNRMLILSGAMVLALAGSGTASAGTQILDCYGAKDRIIACAADYGTVEPAPVASHQFHQTDVRSTEPTEEQIVVVGVRPDWDAVPTDLQTATRSSRPGMSGDWVPVVATSPEDKLQQWQATFLGGEGLSDKLHF
jgi:hypothetical protein